MVNLHETLELNIEYAFTEDQYVVSMNAFSMHECFGTNECEDPLPISGSGDPLPTMVMVTSL
jgi:hypothetical protein